MGTHEELDGLLMPLAKLGFRVIIPNLPGKSKMGCDTTKPVFGVSEKKNVTQTSILSYRDYLEN